MLAQAALLRLHAFQAEDNNYFHFFDHLPQRGRQILNPCRLGAAIQ
jgi:hypothetical protein